MSLHATRFEIQPTTLDIRAADEHAYVRIGASISHDGAQWDKQISAGAPIEHGVYWRAEAKVEVDTGVSDMVMRQGLIRGLRELLRRLEG